LVALYWVLGGWQPLPPHDGDTTPAPWHRRCG